MFLDYGGEAGIPVHDFLRFYNAIYELYLLVANIYYVIIPKKPTDNILSNKNLTITIIKTC